MPHLRIVKDRLDPGEASSITQVLERLLELSRQDKIKHLVVGFLDSDDAINLLARSLTAPRSALTTVGLCESLRAKMVEDMFDGE